MAGTLQQRGRRRQQEDPSMPIRKVREEVSQLLDTIDDPGAETSLRMALAALDETLLRLGMPIASELKDAQEDPLVFGVEIGICPDERLDARLIGVVDRVTSWGK